MKIHILYNFKQGPCGGGNQFLKALKKEFEETGVYSKSPKEADVILFNSHHLFGRVFKLKNQFPEKVFIHRVDGPIALYRGRDKSIDKAIFAFSRMLADGIVFQSNWSKEQNQKLYKAKSKYGAVIHNAPDSAIFNSQDKSPFNSEKVKLIAASWSSNVKKGFDIYKYLDDHLDFSRYEMTFVGNSPFKFKNIKHIEPVVSSDLADLLKSHDIYITASQKDPCSNSLIEALSCSLPAVALNDGGHPELVQNGGELFENKQDIISRIENVARNYNYYRSKMPEFSIKKSAQAYYDFAEKIYTDTKNRVYQPKIVNAALKLKFLFFKLCSRV